MVERVRVVLAEHKPQEKDPAVEDALVRGLMRAQLALSLRLAVLVLLSLGSLPVLFLIAPAVAAFRVFGIPIPWLLLGGLAYPFLFGVGWLYLRLSDRNERDWADLVRRR